MTPCATAPGMSGTCPSGLDTGRVCLSDSDWPQSPPPANGVAAVGAQAAPTPKLRLGDGCLKAHPNRACSGQLQVCKPAVPDRPLRMTVASLLFLHQIRDVRAKQQRTASETVPPAL